MKKGDLNVLIVEDDESIRKVLTEAIQRAGYKAIPVNKGADAVAAAKIKPVHAAIIDCMLPQKNGIEVAQTLRRNGLETTPIFLMSGIYRDKAFANESVRKVEAVEFLHKPFDVNHFIKVLDEHLKSLLDAPKVAIHSLMSAPFASQRERRKALDHIEECSGYDLPFLLHILMDAESSGHLNIINASEELFGITLVKGKIVRVDSGQAMATWTMSLIDHGYLTSQELREFQELRMKGDFLEGLVEAQFLSPHLAGMVKKEQMKGDLVRLVTSEQFRINFAQERKLKEESIVIDGQEFSEVVHQCIETTISEDFLKKFYEPWYQHPLRLAAGFSESDASLSFPVVTRVKGLMTEIKSEITIEEFVAKGKVSEFQLLKAIHFMCLHRGLVFDEHRKLADLGEYERRLRSILNQIKEKDAFGVFQFFGAHPDGKVHEVTRIYRDFAKANHPDTLPQHASPELRQINHQVFALVTSAHDVLTDVERREVYIQEKNQQAAAVQLGAEQILDEGIQLLKKGMFTDAEKKIAAAESRLNNETARLYLAWARLKLHRPTPPAEVLEKVSETLDNVRSEDRRNFLFNMVQGLFNLASGETAAALQSFEKALQLEPKSLDVRREIQAIRGAGGASQKFSAQDILTGDLGEITKSFFRKKLK